MNVIQSAMFTSQIGIVLAALVVVTFIILVVVIARFSARLHYLTTPIFDKAVQEGQEKAEHILSEAREQASNIIVRAHTIEESVTERHAADFEKIRSIKEENLKAMSDEVLGALRGHASEVEKTLKEELDKVKSAYEDERNNLHETYRSISESTRKSYETLAEHMSQQIQEEITKEIESARGAVMTYRKEQYAQIDLEIVRLVEDATRIVLQKSLTLSEHRDIVLSSLRQAKQQGVFKSP